MSPYVVVFWNWLMVKTFFRRNTQAIMISQVWFLKEMKAGKKNTFVIFCSLKKHKITEDLGLERTCGDHPVLPLRQGRVLWSRWQGTHPCGFGMSPGRELHTLPGQLFQSSATLHGKKLLLMLRWNLCFNLWPLTLSCCWALLKRVWHPPRDTNLWDM